ncbi:hypothetical protein [Chitinophaga qingshengii]|uniref:Lipoprotein n=1 Tax=Chitinophaga qingshengii TaxID=1569794 RepID=A0ABR7TJ89_9BACT|nr:hypothetical protein [Chitinophaga qingshengii]MBC9930556.1 hypothetical protein [Chitinophaga qingshengii]
MKLLPIFIIIIVCSCKPKNERPATTHADSLPVVNTTDTSAPATFEEHQDSLRKVILQKKENKILKESFLQEMYIRNTVTVAGDSLSIDIPFNLHGADCGAPDCYSTDVSFGFKLKDSLVFPQKIAFREHEHGCIGTDKKISGYFQLMEQTDKYLIYYSAQHKRALVLFSSNKENGTTAYYFTDVARDRINGKNISLITKNYDEADEHAVYPFTSAALSTPEYESFLE